MPYRRIPIGEELHIGDGVVIRLVRIECCSVTVLVDVPDDREIRIVDPVGSMRDGDRK